MCGRYSIIPEADAWVSAFDLSPADEEEISKWTPDYNVAPGRDVPIVRMHAEKGGLEVIWVRWGLIPFWAKESKIGYRMINARAETVREKPAFRAAYRKRRCLVPADGFYEWKAQASGKQPYLIRIKNRSPFAFAGLWEHWHNPIDDAFVRSCTIIVTQANEFMSQIHDRMPVILSPEDYRSWLDPTAQEAQNLLQPCPNDWMEAFAVSTHVNNPRNNDPACIEAMSGNAGK